MFVYLGNSKCGNTCKSCIDVPNEAMSITTIVILVVLGIFTLIIIVVGVWYLCYYRRRQLAVRRLYLSFPVAVQSQYHPSFQSMEVLDCRAFDGRDMPPTYQQATENRQEHKLT
jgi:hypothetical protein